MMPHDIASLAEIPMRNSDRYSELHSRFPTVDYLRRHARRRAPRFAFEYSDGGAGTDAGIARNWTALDAIEFVPRCSAITDLPATAIDLFGKRYSAPIGVAPMGTPSIMYPGADLCLAKAAQKARVPYVLGLVGGASIEEIAKAAPDVFWLQLYRCGGRDHSLAFDLIRRAESAGAHVLVLTLDVPIRTSRPRELAVGLGRFNTFRPNARMLFEIATSPRWAWAMLRHGQPRFANFEPYLAKKAGLNEAIQFALEEVGGPLSWDEIARYRDRWKRPLVLKGILHPADAEKAVSLGIDGIWVSNHGGRQVEALVPAIDCLPEIVKAVQKRATVLMDSGIRSGADVVRAMALGASSTFAGKAFLWSLGALGAEGPDYLVELLTKEIQAVLAQIGISSPEHAQNALLSRAQIGRSSNWSSAI
jgi:(S)-mandelate dehydrogenase